MLFKIKNTKRRPRSDSFHSATIKSHSPYIFPSTIHQRHNSPGLQPKQKGQCKKAVAKLYFTTPTLPFFTAPRHTQITPFYAGNYRSTQFSRRERRFRRYAIHTNYYSLCLHHIATRKNLRHLRYLREILYNPIHALTHRTQADIWNPYCWRSPFNC